MNKFEQFKKTYDDAIEIITKFQKPLDYEPDMDGLVNWMLETDANPYSYLPHAWASSLYTAEGFAGLLQNIHHAVYDDGDITFVTVNEEPRIVFAYQYDDNFRNRVLSEQEKEIEKRPIFGEMREYEIKVLDITPNEFGPLYDEYHRKHVKKCFMWDAKSHTDIEWVAGLYRKYKCWDETWIQEYKDKIQD